MPDQPLLALEGATLAGRYEIDHQLGEGGMGSVYLAFDLDLNRRPVVIKFPDPAGLSDHGFRERFLMEIRSLASLDHPSITKIHDAGTHGEIPYAVVQYAGGGDLKARLAKGTSSPEEILPWLKVVAAALDFVHRHGYCHRDVKPANIFLDEEGHAYLSDFGIATVMAGADPEATLVDNDLTTKGFFVGSVRYAPPEAMSRDLSPAYDQYSLAVTVFEVLSGEVPVTGETAMDVLITKNNQPAKDIREYVPDFPAEAAAALAKALARAPADRFETCTDFYEAFERSLPGYHGPTSRRWLIVAGASLTALAATLVWQFFFAPPPAPDVIERAPAVPVVTALHQVETGSTPEEFEEAVILCQAYDPNCDMSWFAAEDSRKSVIAPYGLDPHEVSNEEFADFVDETGYRTTAEERGYSYHRYVKVPDLSWRLPGKDRDADQQPHYPVVHVSWFDAEAFCAAAEMRLPTEDEWEFAARGDEKRIFPWGDEWQDNYASWGHMELDGLEVVDDHPNGATPLGHLQMSGNVAEWTETTSDGERVIKGGSWQDDNPARLRAAIRSAESPDYSSSDLGFRCAVDVASGE